MASVSKVSAAIKPLLSQSSAEARRRVLNLYRAWYREVVQICFNVVFYSCKLEILLISLKRNAIIKIVESLNDIECHEYFKCTLLMFFNCTNLSRIHIENKYIILQNMKFTNLSLKN